MLHASREKRIAGARCDRVLGRNLKIKIAQLLYVLHTCRLMIYMSIVFVRAIYFSFFFAAGFGFLFGFLVLCFPVSLISCFSASLLSCLSAFPASLLFLLLCFSASLVFAFPASLLFLLLCFSAVLLFAFPASLLFLLLCFPCFSAFVRLCLSTSTILLFSFLQSRVFAALLPAPLLLCFLSLLSLCFSFSFALFSSVCILNETLERP